MKCKENSAELEESCFILRHHEVEKVAEAIGGSKCKQEGMKSLGELGVGLSVVFGVFVVALVLELCYIFGRKGRGARTGSSKTDQGSRRNIIARQVKADWEEVPTRSCNSSSSSSGGGGGEYAREAAIVGSFGGYPGSPPAQVLFLAEGGRLSAEQPAAPPNQLFPIKEETKEDMEIAVAAVAASGIGKPKNNRLRSRTPSDVLAIHFTSGSSSPTASDHTPFTTPPSSPPLAAAAPFPLMSAPRPANLASPPIRSRITLRSLFDRSPLFGPPPRSLIVSSSH